MEKRKFPRIQWRRPILWRGPQTLDNFDFSRNISEGGLCLAMENVGCKIGDLVQMETTLPTNKAISALGKVKWIGLGSVRDLRCRVGIEFTAIKRSHLNELRHFIGMCRYGC